MNQNDNPVVTPPAQFKPAISLGLITDSKVGVTGEPLSQKDLKGAFCYTHASHTRARAHTRAGVECNNGALIDRVAKGLGYAVRAWQVATAESLINGQDVVSIVPTGEGKTIPVHLVAKGRREFGLGCVVAIEPLIALSADMVRRARERGLVVAEWNSTVPVEVKRDTLDRIRANDIDLVVITAETLLCTSEISTDLCQVLSECASVAVIDESHYAMTAGHYRQAWHKIGELLKPLRPLARYLCTATCQKKRHQQLIKLCGARDPMVIRRSPHRPNLRYEHIVRSPPVLRQLLNRYLNNRVIVYCATVASACRIHQLYRSQGWMIGIYHGQLPEKDRSAAQAGFGEGTTKHVIATDAFGLGVDHPDIRAVVCYDPTDSVDGFVQQAGRAGRDGLPSTIYMASISDGEGWSSRKFLLNCSFPEVADIQRVHQYLKLLDSWADSSLGRIAQMAGLADGSYQAQGVGAWLRRKGLLEVARRDDDRRKLRYRTVGDLAVADWTDLDAARSDAVAALNQLRDLWEQPAEMIPERIVKHFEE